MKRIVTQEDLDQNPDLVTQGIQVGDEIEIPDNPVSLEDETPETPDQNLADDPTPPPPGEGTGGDRPTTNPRRP